MNLKQVISVVSVIFVLSVAGSSQAQAFQPSDVAGLELWLDASDINNGGSQPADGASLATWSDKSGNGRHGCCGIGITFDADGLNGLPSVSFDGSRNNGVATDPGAAPGTGAYAVFTVFQTTNSTGFLFFNTVNNATGIRLGIGQHSAAGTLGVDEQINDTDLEYGATTLVNDDAVHIGFLHRDTNGGLTNIGVDGTVENTAAENRDMHSTGVILIGHRDPNHVGDYKGDISEVLYYVGEVSNSQRSNIESYLTAKWVPEPSSAVLLSLGGLGLLLLRRRRAVRR